MLLTFTGALAAVSCTQSIDPFGGLDRVEYAGPRDNRLSFERNSDGELRSLLSGNGETLVAPVVDCSTPAVTCVAFRGRVFAVSRGVEKETANESNGAVVRQVGCAGFEDGRCIQSIFQSDCALPLQLNGRCSDQDPEHSEQLSTFYVYSKTQGVTAFGDAAECRFLQDGAYCDATGIVFRLESARGIFAP